MEEVAALVVRPVPLPHLVLPSVPMPGLKVERVAELVEEVAAVEVAVT